LLLTALSLGLWRYEATRTPRGPAGLPYYIGRDVTLVGTVAAAPEILDRGENVRVSVESLSTSTYSGGASAARPIGGLILVHTATLAPLAYGDRVSLAGTLAGPPTLPGPSPGAYRAYLATQGIDTVLNYPRLSRLGTAAGNPLLALTIALRGLLEQGIRRILPGPQGALLFGILLGTRTRGLGALTAPFIATGMIHVIAIDGYKVTLLIGAIDRLTRRLLGPRRALGATLAALLFYILLTGATPAGLRAGAMWTLALIALRVGRRSDAVTSLGITAALLALLSPRILWDVGFQLSVAGTAAIVALEPRIAHRLARVPSVARETLAVTLAAQVGTLPLQAAGFGQVSLSAPLANALLLPLLGPIIALGAPAALAGALIPPLGSLLALFVYPFLVLMIAAVEALARLPLAALPVGAWPLTPVLGYYVLLGATAWRPGHPGRPRRHVGAAPGSAGHRIPIAVWTIGGAVALLPAMMAWQAPAAVSGATDAYSLTLLPLGHSQGLFLATPDGHATLIDGGDAPSGLAAALGDRVAFWRPRIEAVVLSDTDRAHVAGLRDLLARYAVGRALDPGTVYPPADYALWRAALRDAAVPERKLRTGARYQLDRPGAGAGAGATLDVLLPTRLDPDLPNTPVALRLLIGRFSLLVLNRFAVDTLVGGGSDALVADGVRRDTVVALPAGVGDPHSYVTLIRLLRPRLVALPSPDDACDDPAADALAARAARAVGALTWQTGGTDGLDLTTDGRRYMMRAPRQGS